MSRLTPRPLIAVLAVLILCTAGSGGKTKITGQVKVYGSEPHTWAGVETEDGKVYAVDRESDAELRTLRGRRLQFTVKILPEPPAFPGVTGAVQVLSWKELAPK
jgi:hypothetical protein